MGPERLATMMLHLIQILFAQTEVTQRRGVPCGLPQMGRGQAPPLRKAWDRGKRAILRIPPDFMRSWSLPNKLAAQAVKLFDQYAISRTGTRRSA